MPAIELNNINNYACRNINLTVRDHELTVLLGPVGSGKTTILNVIAGLVPYSGSVSFNSHPVDIIPARKRKIGYLFQELLLFPHLTVGENIAYGLRVRRRQREAIHKRVEKMIEFLGLENLADRYPVNLSGGEKQRAALARALAISPDILLLDEPLSSLDFKTTKYLRMEIRRIQKELKITTVYVTHDQLEAEEMADRIAVISRGRLEQTGRPDEIFFSPASEAVADYIGRPNILECDASRSLAGGLVEVECGGVKIVVPHHEETVRKIAIFPKDIYVSGQDPPGPDINRFRARVKEIREEGPLSRLSLELGENLLISELPSDLLHHLAIEVGSEIYLILKFRWIRVC